MFIAVDIDHYFGGFNCGIIALIQENPFANNFACEGSVDVPVSCFLDHFGSADFFIFICCLNFPIN